MHDGFGTMELSADGQVVARRTGVYAPVNAPGGAGLSIGNALRTGARSATARSTTLRSGGSTRAGLTMNFTAGPWTMKRPIAGCGSGARLPRRSAATQTARTDRQRARRRCRQCDPSSACQGPETQSRLRRAAKEYNRLWRAGKVDRPEMAEVFVDLIGWLRLAGIALEGDRALAALATLSA